jgi:hypothetical protein
VPTAITERIRLPVRAGLRGRPLVDSILAGGTTMRTISLEHDEHMLLAELLDRRLRDLAIEIRRTDSRRFRTRLRSEVDTLRSILRRLGVDERRIS